MNCQWRMRCIEICGGGVCVCGRRRLNIDWWNRFSSRWVSRDRSSWCQRLMAIGGWIYISYRYCKSCFIYYALFYCCRHLFFLVAECYLWIVPTPRLMTLDRVLLTYSLPFVMHFIFWSFIQWISLRWMVSLTFWGTFWGTFWEPFGDLLGLDEFTLINFEADLNGASKRLLTTWNWKWIVKSP